MILLIKGLWIKFLSYLRLTKLGDYHLVHLRDNANDTTLIVYVKLYKVGDNTCFDYKNKTYVLR